MEMVRYVVSKFAYYQLTLHRIFLLEGIVTVFLGVSCFFLLIDSPQLSTKWLEPDEIRFLELQRFIKDGGRFREEKQSKLQARDLKMVLCNWRL